MKNPLVRAKGLLLSGQCLLYKYLASAPESEHPWPEQLADKLEVLKRRRRRKHRQRATGAKGQPDGVAGGEGKGNFEAVEGREVDEIEGGAFPSPDPIERGSEGGHAADEQTAAAPESLHEDDGGDGGEPEPPLDAEEQAALDQQVALAR